jgi:hypothetical protein
MTKGALKSSEGILVVLELGRKRVFASAVDWPGWCRSGKDEAAALASLAGYAHRYSKVTRTTDVPFSPDSVSFRVVERLPGSATTEFGAPGAVAECEAEPMSQAELDRLCGLVAAAWSVFDGVVSRAPAELRKGPRGGGRDRDEIVDHVLGAEAAYSSKLALKLHQPHAADRAGIEANREALLAALRAGADGKPMRERGWPVRYAARRIAWHVLDHAWEIEDRS